MIGKDLKRLQELIKSLEMMNEEQNKKRRKTNKFFKCNKYGEC